MSTPEAMVARNNRTKLILIVALFMLPPIAAWVAWKVMGDAGAGATTNAGTLIAPARPVHLVGVVDADGRPATDAELRGRWTYVVFGAAGCDQRCERQLYLTRQIRLAMNKDIARVQRLLVLDRAPAQDLAQRLAAEHEDLRWVVRDSSAEPFLQRFRGGGFDAGGSHYFLVDPLGNLMMSYDLEVPAKGMMRDLQKLLKISQIG